MKLIHSIKLGIWILLILNIIMAFCSIWLFTRMGPALDTIISKNEQSLMACENMLINLVFINHLDSTNNLNAYENFENALKQAKISITELEEPEIVEIINNNYKLAFKRSPEELIKTVSAIQLLNKINRKGMVLADKKAKQISIAGAWGIVFMATVLFFWGIFYIKKLNKNLFYPIIEIYTVIQKFKSGDKMRRCIGSDVPHEIKSIYNGINDLLDKDQYKYIL